MFQKVNPLQKLKKTTQMWFLVHQKMFLCKIVHHVFYRSQPAKQCEVKQSITGNGNAAKEQVAAMLCHMYPLKDDIEYLDATDALAAAVCHHLQARVVVGGGNKFNNWKSFIANNEDRILK